MSDSTDKISRGLSAREKQIAPDPLAVYRRTPKDLDGLKQITTKAVGARERMSTLAGAISADVARFRETKAAELASMGKMVVDGVTVDDIGPDKRKRMLDAAVAERSKMARQTSADERMQLRKELAGMREAVAAAKASFVDPIAVLHRQTLDSERRATIAANLDRQGPMGVKAAMQNALASGDLELAAAALDRFDHLSKSEREHISIGKQDFATALVGQEIAEAERALLAFEVAADETDLLNAEAEGKDVSRMRLALGLKRRELEALAPEPEETPVTVTVPTAEADPSCTWQPEKSDRMRELEAETEALWAEMSAKYGLDEQEAVT